MKTAVITVLIVWILLSGVAWMLQPKPDDLSKTNLTWLSDDNPTRREQLGLFNRLNPQYNVRLDPVDTNTGGGMEKVIVQSIAGVGPDLFDSYGSYKLATYVKAGIAWDVTDELKNAGIDVKKDAWKLALSSVVYKGRVYGVPSNVGTPAIWFNKDLFDKYKVPYPKNVRTWKEFLPILQRLTIRDEHGRVKQYGFLCDSWMVTQFIWQWGGRTYTPDGTKCVIDSPEAIAGVQFFHDLMYKYHVMPTPNDEAAMATQGGWGSGTMTLFMGGKGAMALGGRYWLCSLRDIKELKLGAIECPYGPHKIYWGSSRVTIINKNSPRRKAALAFLKYLASHDYNELVNHQADCVSPMKAYCYTDKYMHDPDYPNEDFNAVWRDTNDYAMTEEVSPFINAQTAGRIVEKQLDLVRNNQKPATQAMKAAAREVNAEIQKNLDRDPNLRAEYDRLMGTKAK
ncbi:MAG: extracellular solute-binding protein [Armatimonadota bacterium]|nr:extracellular solute-binding protein [bacterium]